MTNWVNFDDKYPETFPCKGRNYDLKTEDILLGIDQYNKAFKHACFCKSLQYLNISMPFTHWQSLDHPSDT